MYKHLLFDLDGTLINSFCGITNAVIYALDDKGIPHGSAETLKRFIGPPPLDEFRRYAGVSLEESQTLLEKFREYYRNKGIDECEPYKGIAELLQGLRQDGFSLSVATSKPEPFAKRILARFGFDVYFDVIGGAAFDHSRPDKKAVIDYVLHRLGNPDRDTVLMLGDSESDICGARNCGIKTVAVTYGFGSSADIDRAEPFKVLSCVKDLHAYLHTVNKKSDR